MVERRETPRMGSADGRRFARFVTLPTERRLVLSRLGLAVVAGVLTLLAIGHVYENAVLWLHGQPQYETTFAAIALEPAPPAWYRGGAAVFLDRVRRATQREDKPFSVLDLRLDELRREFRLYCWVKRVERVERYPLNRIVVRLDYRRPVARADLPGGNVGALVDDVLLDADGVILPLEDIEEEQAVRLVYIKGLEPPYKPRPGRAWMSFDASEGLEKANERALGAAKLAEFFVSALDHEPNPIPPTLRPVVLHCTELENAFFIQNAEKTMIYWPQPASFETPGSRTAAQRWDDLHRWIKTRPPEPVSDLHYLDFTKEGVVIKRGKEPTH